LGERAHLLRGDGGVERVLPALGGATRGQQPPQHAAEVALHRRRHRRRPARTVALRADRLRHLNVTQQGS
jgi:hypothetical protein